MKLDRQASATNPIATVSRLVRIQVLMKHEVCSKSENLFSCHSGQSISLDQDTASVQTNFVIAPRETQLLLWVKPLTAS